jgi:Cu(I)/Ag(I) efflux system membrane fusion protein
MIIALVLVSWSVNAQHDHAKMQDHKAGQDELVRYETDKKFQEQLAQVYEQSLVLTEAFVSSDPALAKAKASEVKKAMAKVDMKLLKGQAHMDWMKYSKQINGSIAVFEKAASIAEQREAYAAFSANLYKSVKAFGINGKEVYYQHCPMALNNTGAYWLSDKAEIRNPYFGDAMMKCGSTKEKIND